MSAMDQRKRRSNVDSAVVRGLRYEALPARLLALSRELESFGGQDDFDFDFDGRGRAMDGDAFSENLYSNVGTDEEELLCGARRRFGARGNQSSPTCSGGSGDFCEYSRPSPSIDARVGAAQVFVRIVHRWLASELLERRGNQESSRHGRHHQREERPCVWEASDIHCGVHVSDPKRAKDRRDASSATIAKDVRTYRTAECFAAAREPERVARQVASRVLGEWVLRGFNACIVSHGQKGTGKTRTMFGGPRPPPSSPAYSNWSDVGGVLGAALEMLLLPSKTSSRDRLAVGIGCWEVRSDQSVADLLKNERDGHDAPTDTHAPDAILFPEFTTVRCDSLEGARDLVRLARARSVSWTKINREDQPQPRSKSNRSHVFVRIAVCSKTGERARVASLVFADLAGSRPSRPGGGGSVARDPAETKLAAKEDARISSQLLAFGRLVSDIWKAETRARSKGTPPMEAQRRPGKEVISSLREGSLNEIMARMFTGNCKTYALTSVSHREMDYADTSNTIRLAMRVAALKSACVRSFLSCDGDARMQFAAPESVLPPRVASIDARIEPPGDLLLDDHAVSPPPPPMPMPMPIKCPSSATKQNPAEKASQQTLRADELAVDETHQPASFVAHVEEMSGRRAQVNSEIDEILKEFAPSSVRLKPGIFADSRSVSEVSFRDKHETAADCGPGSFVLISEARERFEGSAERKKMDAVIHKIARGDRSESLRRGSLAAEMQDVFDGLEIATLDEPACASSSDDSAPDEGDGSDEESPREEKSEVESPYKRRAFETAAQARVRALETASQLPGSPSISSKTAHVAPGPAKAEDAALLSEYDSLSRSLLRERHQNDVHKLRIKALERALEENARDWKNKVESAAGQVDALQHELESILSDDHATDQGRSALFVQCRDDAESASSMQSMFRDASKGLSRKLLAFSEETSRRNVMNENEHCYVLCEQRSRVLDDVASACGEQVSALEKQAHLYALHKRRLAQLEQKCELYEDQCRELDADIDSKASRMQGLLDSASSTEEQVGRLKSATKKLTAKRALMSEEAQSARSFITSVQRGREKEAALNVYGVAHPPAAPSLSRVEHTMPSRGLPPSLGVSSPIPRRFGPSHAFVSRGSPGNARTPRLDDRLVDRSTISHLDKFLSTMRGAAPYLRPKIPRLIRAVEDVEACGLAARDNAERARGALRKLKSGELL